MSKLSDLPMRCFGGFQELNTMKWVHFGRVIRNPETRLLIPRNLNIKYYAAGEVISQLYILILVPVGVAGNILSFLVSKFQIQSEVI